MITSFYGKITKVLVNGRQVFPGNSRTFEEDAGRKMNIEVSYEVVPMGNIAWDDFWTVGVVVTVGEQKAWGMKTERGSGQKIGKITVTGLVAPSKSRDIKCRLRAIEAVNPVARG